MKKMWSDRNITNSTKMGIVSCLVLLFYFLAQIFAEDRKYIDALEENVESSLYCPSNKCVLEILVELNIIQRLSLIVTIYSRIF